MRPLHAGKGTSLPENGDWIWNYADGYRPLARFASVTALRGLDLLERDAYDELAADAQELGGVGKPCGR